MSKIEDLIKKYCPDGVEYKSFGDVCEYIRGITYNKTQESRNCVGIKVLRANNITLFSNTLNFDDVKVVDDTVRIRNTQWLKKNDILICAGSGSKEHVGKVAYINENMDYSFGGFMAVIRSLPQLNSRFLFHHLTSSAFSDYLGTALNSTTINNLNSGVMNGFQIPVPPLEVQREIVQVLDSFTMLTAELSAELSARKKQYEFYRDQLLTFKNEGENPVTTWKELETVANIRRGVRVVKNQLSEMGKYPVYQNSMKPLGYHTEYNCAGDTAFVIGAGAAGEIGYCANKFWAADDCFFIECTESLYSKFLYHALMNQSDYIHSQVRRASIPRLSRTVLEKIKIPVPSLDIQKRIVEVLDNFEAICSDLKIGLPAEIELRKKQYEYYRDMLLSFEPIGTVLAKQASKQASNN